MGISEFEQRLIGTIAGRCKIWGIWLLFFIAQLIFQIVYYRKTGSNQGMTPLVVLLFKRKHWRNKYTTKQQISLTVMAIVLVLAFAAWGIIPICRDIAGQQYIAAEASYQRAEPVSGKGLFSNGQVTVEIEGESLTLDLPAGWTAEEFPAGSFTGTVWYGRESEIILAFVRQIG